MTRPPGLVASDEFAHLLVIDGRLVGRWRRFVKTSAVLIEVQPFRSLTRSERRALDVSAARYGEFVNLAVTLSPA